MNNKVLFALSMLFAVSPAMASNYKNHEIQYQVTVTNITKGQTFTPIISATHQRSVSFFELGQPATIAIETMAEGGDTSALKSMLEANPKVTEIVSTDGLLSPGESVSFAIKGSYYSRFSFAAMLLPTNDTFVSIDSVRLPFRGQISVLANAYDAGTENNSELCIDIPGPTCGGEGYLVDSGEGYIFPSPGVHGEAELQASAYDWQGAVAKVKLERIYR